MDTRPPKTYKTCLSYKAIQTQSNADDDMQTTGGKLDWLDLFRTWKCLHSLVAQLRFFLHDRWVGGYQRLEGKAFFSCVMC